MKSGITTQECVDYPLIKKSLPGHPQTVGDTRPKKFASKYLGYSKEGGQHILMSPEFDGHRPASTVAGRAAYHSRRSALEIGGGIIGAIDRRDSLDVDVDRQLNEHHTTNH